MSAPVFRFAPSPNGHLHLGHAYSALLNAQMAHECGGRFLVRIEDIDTVRCTDQLCQDALNDLEWLGLQWEQPVRRQSEHFKYYKKQLEKLKELGVLYRAFMTRSQIRKAIEASEAAQGIQWPRDPDGAPLYPGGPEETAASDTPHAWRLDMTKALALINTPMIWQETGIGPAGETAEVAVDGTSWGDVILARKDTPTSYHLSVVVDDALQGITRVVRGQDLFYATSVHRILQHLLSLTPPCYHHHGLVLNDEGKKLSKSARDTSLRDLRADGMSAREVRRRLGFS